MAIKEYDSSFLESNLSPLYIYEEEGLEVGIYRRFFGLPMPQCADDDEVRQKRCPNQFGEFTLDEVRAVRSAIAEFEEERRPYYVGQSWNDVIEDYNILSDSYIFDATIGVQSRIYGKYLLSKLAARIAFDIYNTYPRYW